MKKLLLALAMLLGLQTLAFAQLSAPSTWTSQQGSVLKVTWLGGGGRYFRRTFVNTNPDWGCAGIPYPVTGFNFGGDIQFSVYFVKCRVTASWRGAVTGAALSAFWEMRRNGVTTTGLDNFRQ